jgi:Raf kinase inhibitor-like YbhB/YbcL family protein
MSKPRFHLLAGTTIVVLAVSGFAAGKQTPQNGAAGQPTSGAQANRGAGGRQAGNAPPPPPLRLTSAAVGDGVQIPAKYTCSAEQPVSPALQWTNPPRGTQSFVLIVHDMEPRPRKGVDDILHWMVWDMPGTASQLPEAVLSNTADLPDGSHQTNGNAGQGGITGYRPPCPPQGVPVPHHYAFEIFALDQKLNLPENATRADVQKAMDGHIVGHSSIVALFNR